MTEERAQAPDSSEEHSSIEFHSDEVTEIEGDVPPSLDIPREARALIISDDQSYATHGLHSYPAKYIPEIPRWAIRKYSEEDDTVLDPFAGSGTTNIEALLHGRDSYATEIDHLAKLLIRVKTNPVDPTQLREAKERLFERIENTSASDVGLPDFHNRDHWFEKEMSEALAVIKTCVEDESDDDIRDFFRVCFSAIVRDCSNADPGSFKPCVRKGRERNLPDPWEKFEDTVEKNIESAEEYIDGFPYEDVDAHHTLLDGDATSMDAESESVDLAVTSPPYINAVDYVRTHKLEWYWLGFATGSLAEFKSDFVGTERIPAEKYRTLNQSGHSELDDIISSIYEEDEKRAYVVYKYYEDMKDNLEEVYRVLKPGSHYIVVVGDNTVRGHDIKNWKYLADFAEDIGFELDNIWMSGIINHYIPFDRDEKIDEDGVLVLKKPE